MLDAIVSPIAQPEKFTGRMIGEFIQLVAGFFMLCSMGSSSQPFRQDAADPPWSEPNQQEYDDYGDCDIVRSAEGSNFPAYTTSPWDYIDLNQLHNTGVDLETPFSGDDFSTQDPFSISAAQANSMFSSPSNLQDASA